MPTADDRVNILVVDDLPEKILVLESVLAELGEKVVVARSGAEALQEVLKRDFAVILLDVNMPGMDGYETAQYIRRRKRSAHTPIIFITGYGDEMHRAQGYSLGAVDYILSPVVPDILRSKVRVFAELFRMTEQVRRHADQRVRLAQEQAAREAAEQMADALRASEERFRLASEAVTGFIYEVDLNSGRSSVSPGLLPLLGLAPEAARHRDWWEQRLHPNDRARALATHRQTLQAGERLYRHEYRLRHEDGHYLHVWDQGLIVNDASGRPVRVVGNVVDITERKKAEEALAEANRRKDEFLAMLAHELRNPLAPVRNAAQMMRFKELADPDLVWCRDVIERQVEHLTRLVEDLLDVSRITRGKIVLRTEPIDLAAAVTRAVETARPLLDARRHELTVDLPSEPVCLQGDLTRLAQVVGNLLNNAAKYTPEGGRVHVTLTREKGEAVLRVQDNGSGIPPDVLPKVFDLFTQAERTLDRAEGGLGIGLSLVRSLVEMHGGRVQAFSAGTGKGSEFVVCLPLGKQEGERLKEECTPAGTEPASNHPLSYLHPSKRILVVDDNADSAESMVLLLRMLGNDVTCAFDGPTALEIALAEEPDVILLDIGLPGMDGYEVCRRLRDAGRSRALVVAVTGYGQDEDRLRSQRAGFDAHLVKPVDLDVLQALLARSPLLEV